MVMNDRCRKILILSLFYTFKTKKESKPACSANCGTRWVSIH